MSDFLPHFGTPRPNAIGADRKHRIHTQTMYHVSGYSRRGWKEMRVEAPSADAAMAIAHRENIRVVECIELKQKQK